MQADNRRWQDWASFALGLWLAVSPWLTGYAEEPGATANAALVGLALAVTAHYGWSCEHASCEWLSLLAGLWLLAAPFVLGFASDAVPTANALVVGANVAALSASALHLERNLGRFWQRTH